MEMQENITVIVSGQKIIVPSRVISMSQFLHNIRSLGFEQQDIHIDTISKNIFVKFIQFCEINKYQEPKIPKPIKSNNLEDVLTQENLNFLKQFPFQSPQFIQLVKAASFLGCRSLLNVCSAQVACIIYFEDTKAAFEKKCQQLGVKQKIQFSDEQRFKKAYPFMNS